MGIASDITTYGHSPDEDDVSASLYDDGDCDGDDDLGNLVALPTKRKSSSAASRKGPQGADKRASHNAIERARRESLNGRFMTLAEALPSMAKVKRPSKSVIVNKALDFVFEAQVKESALTKENAELRREVNELRQQLGLPPLPPSNASVNKKHSVTSQHSSSASVTFGSPLDLTNSTSQFDNRAGSSIGGSPPTSSRPDSPAIKSEQSLAALQTSSLTYPMAMPITTSMFANAGSPTNSLVDPSDSFSASSLSASSQMSSSAPVHAVATSPFALHQQQMATMSNIHAHNMLPASFGYLSPEMLQAQQQQQQHAHAQQQHQQQLLFAAALQQQQQQLQQQHPHAGSFDLYGINSALLNNAWAAGYAGHA
ncbi:BZ3500_MvSof-1268-A1-R1_Chr3-1g05988 [Microbotryum saponariae]|uniref:BZ3500_MvSof-1268-A1-R1_Chr3-1g05988 protein n=1 Tax=Microbotryum saponariae TaxID=289078 RepID=A0A2X0MXU7_9BASI|nr:BZ3500_MvSof-1268-A1-R1_Chr3-1g05988 [Microbotryum saponariae]SDA05178.1 BZ3501_MvSof-1269-A2-R1_Chr3-1g05658 [Microbotryum saponariae]